MKTIISFALLLFVIGCFFPLTPATSPKIVVKNKDNLVPIDYTDTLYRNLHQLQWATKDTVTAD
jgi:hypothetical protein